MVHIKDILNTMLLSAPLIIAVHSLFSILRGKKGKFLLIAFSFSLLFTLAVDPTLGAYRDWDLLARFSIPVLVFYFGLINFSTDSDRRSLYAWPYSAGPVCRYPYWQLGLAELVKGGRLCLCQGLLSNLTHTIHWDTRKGFRNKSWGYFCKKPDK